ncbi:MAG TPA: D-glycerate dehydrogenase [Dehalococcoidia bacterium]|nr:D-glycerate dehydrogenase [Dehalococcoidia bacterium]
MPPRVFVSREIPGEGIARLRAAGLRVDLWNQREPPPAGALFGAAAACDGLLTMLTERVDGALLEAAPRVRIVSNMAVGFDNIDVEACTRRGVLVTNTPGVLTDTTADLAFALILAVARRVVEGDRLVREGGWGPWHPSFLLGRDVHGATLGIVGLGAIGLAVARRAAGFGMRMLYTARAPKPEAERELGVKWCSLDELLRQSDFVSLHVSLNAGTRELIGERELALMKPTAYLVNTSRGGVVDQQALVRALRAGGIAGAGLDVTAVEPLPAGDPLLDLPNVIITPHVGSATVDTRTKMADLAVENLIAFFSGGRPSHCVNPEVLGSARS